MDRPSCHPNADTSGTFFIVLAFVILPFELRISGIPLNSFDYIMESSTCYRPKSGVMTRINKTIHIIRSPFCRIVDGYDLGAA